MSPRLWWIAPIMVCTACGPREGSRAGAGGDEPAVVAELTALIGEMEGAAEYLFGDVTSVAAGPGDLVYVADRIGSTVRAYDASGRFVATIGSEGQGPGEFEWPADVTLDPAGRLYVRDASRITVFAPRVGALLADSLLRTISLEGYGNLSSTRARASRARYYYPGYLFRDDEPARYFYLVFDAFGATGDTVEVPRLPGLDFFGRASYRTGPTGGRLVPGVNRAPFEPFPSWDLSGDGTLITSTGDRYEIVEWNARGETERVRAFGDPEGAPIPEAERADSARAFRARLDSIPVALDEVSGMSPAARGMVLPETRPAVLALHAAADGSVWLRRWPRTGSGAESRFDVIGPGDDPPLEVVVPLDLQTDPPPFVSTNLLVGVLRDPATEVERVAVFRIPGG